MTTRILDFADGFQSAAAPTSGAISVGGIKVFANDAAYVTDKGSAAAEGDMYFNSTTNFVRIHDGSAFIELVDASATQTIGGNKTLSGTTTIVNSTNLEVADKNILINDGGNDASAEGAGLTVERTATNGSLVYENALTSKWKAGAAGSEVELATISGAQVITNKDIDGGTASNTRRITLPKDTLTNLNALTRKEGTLVYDTTGDDVYFDDGSSLVQLAAAGATESNKYSLVNVGLAASVAANALTISLKQSDGSTNPSTGASQVQIPFRSSTIGSGAFNVRSVTSSLSTVISSGSTAGHGNGTNNFLFIYALDNSGTVELAWSSSLQDTSILATTTAEGGAGGADSRTTIYSTTARTNVPIRLLGSMLSNQTTAGTWASVPTRISPAMEANVQSINKFQQKILGVDVTGTGNVTDISFSGLKVGKAYRVSGQLYLGGNATTDDINGVFTNTPNTVAIWGVTNIGNVAWVNAVNFIFVAETSALTFTVSTVSGSGMIIGNGTTAETYLTIEELNNYTPTTEF